jgi:polyisoprenoid-binding protein YceI
MLSTPARRLVATVVVLFVAGVAGWWFFLRDDAPEAANIDDARETIEEESAGGAAEEITSLDGTWRIDPSIGSFDDFTSNFAGYRIDEELANIGANTAVGRTPDVNGEFTITGNQVTEGSFEVDLTTLESDDDRRDGQMRSRGLQTETFPTATFTLTEPIDLPADTRSGNEISFDATGELALHGVTNPITIEFGASLTDGIIALAGSAPVRLADYGIDPPVGFAVVSVADEGELEFQLYLRQAA